METEFTEELYQYIDDFPDLITLDRQKTCIGKKRFVYYLKTRTIENDFFDFFREDNSKLTFPLGEQYLFFSINVPEKYCLTGILGTREVKVILKFSANIIEKEAFEKKLVDYCQK